MRRLLSGARRGLVAGLAILLRGRRGDADPVPPRRGPDAERRAVGLVLAALGGAALGFAAFAAGYLLDLGTQVLGAALAIALALLSVAALIAARRLVASPEETEGIGERDHAVEREQAALTVHEAGPSVTRRRLLAGAAAGTGCVAAGALLLPAASLGPLLDTARLRETPWRAGRRLVGPHGEPIRSEQVEVGSFVTAFAAGSDHRALDASVIVVRVLPEEVDLPPERREWAPDGLIAYSKICTHAGCAVSVFNYPTHRETQPRPELVCPCHYSAFDAGGGGEVLAGPAGRPLPQLPLSILDDATLAAAGELAAPPGPSWGGVRR